MPYTHIITVSHRQVAPPQTTETVRVGYGHSLTPDADIRRQKTYLYPRAETVFCNMWHVIISFTTYHTCCQDSDVQDEDLDLEKRASIHLETKSHVSRSTTMLPTQVYTVV